MKINRHFSIAGRSIENQVKWRKTDVVIHGEGNSVIFEQKDVEIPERWSENAASILAQKYFRKAGVPTEVEITINDESIPQWLSPSIPTIHAIFQGETSAKQVFHRLAGCWTYWGWKEGIFSSENDAIAFFCEMYIMLANQIGAPNSPQWFNTGLHWAYGIEGPDSGQWICPEGIPERIYNSYINPQVHACFIQPVSDDLVNPGGIMDLWTKEARMFKHGSGTGTNFSNLRAKGEHLSGGGTSSGLMSFLKIGDAAAGSIKSGGTTRRAAKMVCLDADHPEIFEFINWKSSEERKARAMALGSQALNDGGPVWQVGEWEGECISTVSGQNSNNSIRIIDKFIETLHSDRDKMWLLKGRTDRTTDRAVLSTDLWNAICKSAWESGDPGVQFHDTINKWHTCKADGDIHASNPCCFVAGTLIDTSEGLIDIADLERACNRGEQLPYAFSFDNENSLPTLTPITNAWVAGFTKSLVDVYLDSGEVFRCTPEHRWLARSGRYIEAEKLQPGTSLRKIGRFTNWQRSNRCCILHRCTPEIPNGTVYQSRWMWEQVNGKIPEGFEIHHLNDDPTDDRISNFELKKILDHRSFHSEGRNNPRFIEVDSKLLVEVYDAVIANRKHRTSGLPVTPGLWNEYIRRNRLKGIVPFAQSPTLGGRIQGMSWEDFVEYIELTRGETNAKIIRIERIELDEAVEVYDIETKGNFAIRANTNRNAPSIIVHNSEYMFLDDTACNLASMRLTKFLKDDGTFDIKSFCHATHLWTLVLEISVYMASYPSKEIAENSFKYRTLGLGYADAGALLMRLGIPYDSEEGRDLIAAITALLHAETCFTSWQIADELGPFDRFEINKDSMMDVMTLHQEATYELSTKCRNDSRRIAIEANLIMETLLSSKSFRNAQGTLIAPTGTISFVMDCDTTGIEPDFSLVKHKKLAGGGFMKIVNESIEPALRRLKYTEAQIRTAMEWVSEHGTFKDIPPINGIPFFPPEHLAVFDCSVPTIPGGRSLDVMSHIKMCAAVQPFLSGAISKTVNFPVDGTVEDVSRIYLEAHKLGLKSVALYRDQSKTTQPLSSGRIEETPKFEFNIVKQSVYITSGTLNDLSQPIAQAGRGIRKRLSNVRKGEISSVVIDGHRIYLTTGEYEDGTLGEIFVNLSREGSTVRSIMECFSKAISIGLQYGVPLDEFVDAFIYTKFEPAGIVQGSDSIKLCSSIPDLIFRMIGIKYLGRTELANTMKLPQDFKVLVGKDDIPVTTVRVPSNGIRLPDECPQCHQNTLERAGTCVACRNCEYNSGCG